MTTRRTTAVVSLVLGLATAALPMVSGGAAVHAQLLLGSAGVVVLVAALLGWTPGFSVAAVALGTEYALRLAARHRLHRLDGLAVAEAVALFATVEIGLRSLDARSIARPEADVRRVAALRLAAMIAGAAVSAFVVVALGSRRLPAPTAGLALGLAAAVVLLVSAELVRRRVTRPAASR